MLLLDKTFSLERQTVVKDAVGGNVPTWGTVSGFGSVPCSVAPASWRTAQEFSRKDFVLEAEVYTNIDVGAATTDRLEIAGVKYPVLAVKPFSNKAVSLEELWVIVCGKRN